MSPCGKSPLSSSKTRALLNSGVKVRRFGILCTPGLDYIPYSACPAFGVHFRVASGEYSPFAIRLFPHIIRKRLDVPRRVHQLQHARRDEFYIRWRVRAGWEDGELFDYEEIEIPASHFLSRHVINNK